MNSTSSNYVQPSVMSSALRVNCQATRRAVHSAAHRLAGLLANRVATARRVPGLEWTAGDTIAHLVGVTRVFAQLASCEVTPEDIWNAYAPGLDDRPANERFAALNAAMIAVDRGEINRGGELVEAAVADFLSSTEGRDPGALFRSVEGDIDVATVSCLLLGELLIHGRDVARGLGMRWVIFPDEARLALSGVVSLLPDYLDRGQAGDMRATFDIRVRGGPRFALWVHDGRLDVTPTPTERVDCHISADPVTYLLVGYGRANQWPAALQGKLVAWGRRPWLGLRLARLLVNP